MPTVQFEAAGGALTYFTIAAPGRWTQMPAA
jgi:hypothetical protein